MVTVGGIVFGFLGWDKYKDIESSVTQRAETHFQKVDQDMQSMLRQRIDDEFKTEKIQELIRTEAKAQTKEGLKNEISSLRQDVDSSRASVAAVLRRQVGPFAWSMSLIGPDFDASPGTRAGNYLASFIPNEDITVMRIVAPFGGRGYVDAEDPCSHPPSFYLSVGQDRGASNAKYAISMLGAGGRVNHPVDSGPLSVDFSAGVPIIASYQFGYDATRTCHNKTNPPNGNPVNFTVEYTTKRATK